MAAEVVYLATAEADLASIYDWLSEVSEPSHAFAYIDRIQTACEALADFPGRGAPRDDLDPGLRSIVFRRRATIYYRAGPAAVEIVRVLYAGRDAGRAFSRS